MPFGVVEGGYPTIQSTLRKELTLYKKVKQTAQ